ncbi:MAG: hypothetical protein M3R38_17335 [Actinomycetota bacterium]|nr:hypothetical protein [Actinomycetota bacterium]
MEIPTYRPGDTITLELDLRDDSGVGEVFVQARSTEGRGIIAFTGNGEGQQQATLALTYEVPEHIESGEYRVAYIETRDTVGNYGGADPDIRFRIEAPEGDFKGPEVSDVRLS